MQFSFKSLLIFVLLTSLGFSANHQETSEKKPRVSIITSVFKGDEYMELFLSNIVKQTIFDECELILINAASPENEEPIIEPYLKKYPNISYERLEKDPTMHTPSMNEKLEAYPNLSYFFGPWTSSVSVHNRDIERCPDFDILLMANDDTISITEGYDKIITEIMSNSFLSYDGTLMVKTSTETEKNMLSAIGKKYYERFGYVYYPGYHSGYYDEEFIAVGELLNRAKEMAGISLTTSKASEKQNMRVEEDFELFSQREASNYHVQPSWFNEEDVRSPKEERIPVYRIPLCS